jgi:hypothetical protein
MNVNEAYLRFISKVNKNLNSDNITADRPRFVMLYNENQIRRILQLIREGNDERIREIHHFLKPDTSLTFKSKKQDRVLYKLPSDYLELSNAYAIADKEECKNKKIFLWEIKDRNYSQVLSDNYNLPSFEYREAPFVVADNSINVFTGDFDYKKVILSYYRYPRKIDIEGYITIDNSTSSNVNPEGDERFIDKVISMAATDFARNYHDMEGIQINKERVINNN